MLAARRLLVFSNWATSSLVGSLVCHSAGSSGGDWSALASSSQARPASVVGLFPAAPLSMAASPSERIVVGSGSMGVRFVAAATGSFSGSFGWQPDKRSAKAVDTAKQTAPGKLRQLIMQFSFNLLRKLNCFGMGS